MISKARLRLALLECMETLTDELRFGPLTERQERVMTRLADLCNEALDHPSVADTHRIRQEAADALPRPVA